MTAQLVLITGLSGSGKSTVAKCFEDLGFYCVDNLPLPLLRSFLEDPVAHVKEANGIAVVTDVRAPGFAEDFPRLVAEIDQRQTQVALLFLEASDEALVRRFSETRRPHPLALDRPVIEGIRSERKILQALRDRADMIFDTSEWTVHEIRNHVYREFASEPGEVPTMAVSIVSFGFKHGIPYGTDTLYDVRFLANPHFIPGLREKTGEDPEVLAFLEVQSDFADLVGRIQDFLLFSLPRYRRENRSYFSIAIGCTGGKHRSVAVAEQLAEALGSNGWPVHLVHRDIKR